MDGGHGLSYWHKGSQSRNTCARNIVSRLRHYALLNLSVTASLNHSTTRLSEGAMSAWVNNEATIRLYKRTFLTVASLKKYWGYVAFLNCFCQFEKQWEKRARWKRRTYGNRSTDWSCSWISEYISSLSLRCRPSISGRKGNSKRWKNYVRESEYTRLDVCMYSCSWIHTWARCPTSSPVARGFCFLLLKYWLCPSEPIYRCPEISCDLISWRYIFGWNAREFMHVSIEMFHCKVFQISWTWANDIDA